MRNGWRKSLNLLALGLGISLVGATSPCPAAWDGSRTVRLTIEVAWSAPAESQVRNGETAEVGLELSEGRVVDVVSAPTGTVTARGRGPAQRSATAWKLGSDSAGRVRARIETTTTAS